MVGFIRLLLTLLALFGGATSATETPSAASIRVIARACPSGAGAAHASTERCPVWPDGAAMQASDRQGNAWGMNASRDSALPGNPVVYSLDGMKFGTYLLSAPILPAGFTSVFVDGVQTEPGGYLQLELGATRSHAEITVYFLR